MKIKRTIYNVNKSCQQIFQQRKNQWQFYNCWTEAHIDSDIYWYRFMKSKQLMRGKRVAFFSCFGPRNLVHYIRADFKLFCSGENLKTRYLDYADYCLGDHDVDLALGMERFDAPDYVRFPIWMDYMFDAEHIEEDYIKEQCAKIRFPDVSTNVKFAAIVASNPELLRQQMFDELNKIQPVCSAGKYMHNDDSLIADYNDIKMDYLQQFVFSICPENSYAAGYCTEKLFEAMRVGAIPIYWGERDPEPDVINKEAFIYWDKKDNGTSALRKIDELWHHESLRKEFMTQPRLLPTAEEYVLDTYTTIEHKIKDADV